MIRLFLAVGSVAATLSLAYSQPITLGQVHFKTSCRSDLNARFDEGVALLHSFEFLEAEEVFQEIEKHDPTCSIAGWGIAIAQTERAGANASPKRLAIGWTQLQPWLAVRAKTKREQMYIDAVRAMYEGYADTPGTVRWTRYLTRMDAIRRQYPEDSDAALLYALGRVWTSGVGEKGIEQRRKALDILLPIFRSHPNHPGAAHYIIHAADTPELAQIALPAAHKYAEIAPASPHALHMPSHIFSRLGYWPETINSNEESARVATEWIRNGRNARFDEHHALTYLEYGYLQLNDLPKAREQITRIRELMSGPGGDPWAEIDAQILFDVQTGDWQGAISIEAPASSPVTENFDIYWVHTIAAACLGKLDVAQSSLRSLSDAISQQQPEISYAHILHLDLLQATAAVQMGEGKAGEAIQTLENAVAFEREHPVDYPNVLAPPSAEALGGLLLMIHRPAEALRAYRQAMIMAPNRLISVEGERRSLSEIGK
jgi:tetratricopeptide (TPR) repeat protein